MFLRSNKENEGRNGGAKASVAKGPLGERRDFRESRDGEESTDVVRADERPAVNGIDPPEARGRESLEVAPIDFARGGRLLTARVVGGRGVSGGGRARSCGLR